MSEEGVDAAAAAVGLPGVEVFGEEFFTGVAQFRIVSPDLPT